LKLRMAQRAAEGGLQVVSEGFAEGARDAHEQAQRIRTVLFRFGNGDGATEPDTARAEGRQETKRAAAKIRKGRAVVKRRRTGKA